MLRKIGSILKTISEMRKRDKYLDGYYYAAGELLRGTPTIYFEEKMEIARATLTHTHFDSGVEAAIHDWQHKCNNKYRRS